MQFRRLKRREFVRLIGSAAVAWPLAARAQQPPGKPPIIGFLGTDALAWRAWTDAFVDRLRTLGWVDGSTTKIEYRWSEGQPEQAKQLTAEFVRLKTNVIVSAGTSAVAAKQVTSDIPIVFAITNDPIGEGLVSSLARPGANVTGLSSQSFDITGKRIELLGEVIPNLRRLAVIFDADFPQAVEEMHEVEAKAHSRGLEVVPLEIRKAQDIAPAFASLKNQVDALYIVSGSLTTANRTRVMIFALTSRLPTIGMVREQAQSGALLSYGANVPSMFRRAAELVDKILRGTKPGDIPIEQPTKFDLVLNLMTAEALGLSIPASIQSRADEVIE
jgi:putative ABC transport system substrate-binding protein